LTFRVGQILPRLNEQVRIGEVEVDVDGVVVGDEQRVVEVPCRPDIREKKSARARGTGKEEGREEGRKEGRTRLIDDGQTHR